MKEVFLLLSAPASANSPAGYSIKFCEGEQGEEKSKMWVDTGGRTMKGGGEVFFEMLLVSCGEIKELVHA